MSSLIIGATGVLGSALHKLIPDTYAPTRKEYDLTDDPSSLPTVATAYLCAGTKGHQACEGNQAVFQSDVDGNIRLAKSLLKRGTFVVFVSSDAVEWWNSAYSRNRLLVEMALIMQPNVAIVRPGRFDGRNVGELAFFCRSVGHNRIEGVHYWVPPLTA